MQGTRPFYCKFFYQGWKPTETPESMMPPTTKYIKIKSHGSRYRRFLRFFWLWKLWLHVQSVEFKLCFERARTSLQFHEPANDNGSSDKEKEKVGFDRIPLWHRFEISSCFVSLEFELKAFEEQIFSPWVRSCSKITWHSGHEDSKLARKFNVSGASFKESILLRVMTVRGSKILQRERILGLQFYHQWIPAQP